MNLILRIHCDQLLIASNTEIVETISMSNKIKGVYKENALILFISRAPEELRKIKFQVKSNPSKCYEELNKYFPVINHSSKQPNDVITPRYLNIEDVISHVLKTKEPTNVISHLPPSFKNFVRICFLDPTFPKLVQDVQSIICNESKTV
ncbi:PREDICTED: uncharacterized protein LOC106110124 [Papilio polytes]|uniref:uncharacterized protein LOC106110124 n=1 Tax=Papilio polytes TaxID=76194 RepID=UPI000675E212|nr:PREDICTED: uncharacterized protein LOC106110124 [Papilio polytes]